MPNHCYNVLTITGKKQELQEFKEYAKGVYPWDKDEQEELSCAKFIPPPQEAIDNYGKVGYDWCNKHWGTKWGCYNIDVQLGDRQLVYTFDSAWSPPIPVIDAMSKQYPTLKFHLWYRECGMGFAGHYVLLGGKVQRDDFSSHYRGNCGG